MKRPTPTDELTRLRGVLKQVTLALEDSEPWANHYLALPGVKPVDVERMACSIRDALHLIRSQPE